MKNFTLEERKLIANLLNMAADEFSNHGCNDYPLANTQENRQIVSDAYRGDDDEWADEILTFKGEKLYTMDWLLMRHFAQKVLKND